MNPERWQKLDELFHLALECEPGQRNAFIADACKGDEELRRELESMLEHHEQARDFIESPAYAIERDTLIDGPAETLLPGARLGHYKVRSHIAKGGMGEVYLAQDIELGRYVALKILPHTLFEDPDRLRRFEREARAASALNHPTS